MPVAGSKLVDLECTLEHETDKAYLFDFGDKQVWVPKSLSEWDEREKIVTLPEWFAQAKEII